MIAPCPADLDAPTVFDISLDPDPVSTARLTGGGPPRVCAVVPVGLLTGAADPIDDKPSSAEVARAVVATAGRPTDPADPAACQFPIDPVPAMVRLKLNALRDHWRCELAFPEPEVAVFRFPAPGGLVARLAGRVGGVEVTVRVDGRPGGFALARVAARVYGRPTDDFAAAGAAALPGLVRQARQALQNRGDRRGSGRVAADCPVWVFPVTADGRVFPAVPGRCRDLSAGGVGFTADGPVSTDYAYVVVGDDPAAARWAILTHLVRSEAADDGYRVGGRYATWG